MNESVFTPRSIPLWIKVVYTLWLFFWVPVIWHEYGPANFLWLCDAANFLIALALWLESPLLLSAQAISVLIIQTLWTVDFTIALLLGTHPIGGTEYMFDSSLDLVARLHSLFHIWVPVLLVWSLLRLGYDRRGLALQTVIAWILLPLSAWAGNEVTNLNWLWAPFGIPQTFLPFTAWVLFAMVAYPLVIYLTTHLVLVRVLPSIPSSRLSAR